MRKGAILTYMLSDHLGSTSLTTDSAGNVISELRYTVWGEVRYQAGTTSTSYTYTGQYSNTADFGLMFYNARWYDSQLGRFAQADSIVPGGVQGYDRYAYVNNNPLRYTDPSGHSPFVTPRTTCDLDCWRARHADDNAGRGPCTYHLCSNTNLYQLGWENSSQAWSIWTNPNATYGQRFGAGTYMSFWGGAHAAGAVGAAGLACVAAGPGCVTLVESTLGIGAGANTVCGGDMCASETDEAITVYRVWGGKSGPFGQSWTDVDPRSISNYRDLAGLPNANTGEYLSIGRLINNAGVSFRNALSLDGNAGGLSEVLIPNAETQVIIDVIINLIPPY